MKYNVTNISASSEKGARNVFLTEAGKLLRAGDSVVCNRIDAGTRGLAKAGLLQIDEGDFVKPSIFKDVVPEVEDDAPSPPRPENLAARKADAEAMDARIAAAAAADAEALSARMAAADDVGAMLAADVQDATPASTSDKSTSNKKPRGKF